MWYEGHFDECKIVLAYIVSRIILYEVCFSSFALIIDLGRLRLGQIIYQGSCYGLRGCLEQD